MAHEDRIELKDTEIAKLQGQLCRLPDNHAILWQQHDTGSLSNLRGCVKW